MTPSVPIQSKLNPDLIKIETPHRLPMGLDPE